MRLAGRALAIGLLITAIAPTGCAPPPAQEQVELHIESDGDFLAFKPAELTVQAGARVKLSFHHAGHIIAQDHDWVLLIPGAAAAFEAATDRAGDNYASLLRNNTQVIAATPIARPGQTVTVEFVAPAPGQYPFICSTPGHGEEMHGLLHVTA